MFARVVSCSYAGKPLKVLPPYDQLRERIAVVREVLDRARSTKGACRVAVRLARTVKRPVDIVVPRNRFGVAQYEMDRKKRVVRWIRRRVRTRSS